MRVQQKITKANCTEIKALNNPPPDVLTVVVAVADFHEGADENAESNTFSTAKRKMLDVLKHGPGIRERVNPQQLEILRGFRQAGITEGAVRAKSSAVALFAAYLIACHDL